MLTQSSPASIAVREAEKGFKLLNGTRLYYEILGDGPPLVFIHGFTLDHRMWDDQFYFFSKWFRCIRYDIRGHGQSALPGKEPYTYQEDLKQLLFSLEITKPVILVGLSMGGRIAANFALQYPRFTRALVLADTQIEGYAFRQFNLEQIFQRAKKKSIDIAKRKWLEHPVFAQAKQNKLVGECISQMVEYYSGWHFVEKNPVTHYSPPTWQLLQDISMPALVLYGEFDLPDFIEMSEGAAARIPGAKKMIIPGAGHLSNMEAPAIFNETLRDFLSGLPA